METQDKQETTTPEPQLKDLAADYLGMPRESQEEPVEDNAPEPVKAEPSTEAVVKEAEPAKKDAGQPEPLKAILDDTPFKGDDVVKGVESLSKSYKELQARLTKDRERYKPHDDLIDLLEKDPDFKQAVQLVRQFKDNPEMVKAYAPNALQPPDPSHFDIFSPEGKAQYDKALADYTRELVARETDSRLNSRFAELDRQRMRERQFSELKSQFPDADPEEVEKYAIEKSRTLSLADFYRLKNYDSREAVLTEKIRKELTQKMEQAASGKTPSSATGASETVTAVDIQKHIVRYGHASALKKYGQEILDQAYAEMANAY